MVVVVLGVGGGGGRRAEVGGGGGAEDVGDGVRAGPAVRGGGAADLARRRRVRVGREADRVVEVLVDVLRVRQQAADLAAQDAADAADGGHVELVADAVREQPLADLPREDARVLLLQLADVSDHLETRETCRRIKVMWRIQTFRVAYLQIVTTFS